MNKMFPGITYVKSLNEWLIILPQKKIVILASVFWQEYPKHPDSVCANDANNTKASKMLCSSSSLSYPISVCSVVSVCSVNSVSLNKNSSSLKKSSPKDPNKSKLGSSPVRPVQPYSQSSRKRTPSGRDKNVRNWSWPLTRMVLVSGH